MLLTSFRLSLLIIKQSQQKNLSNSEVTDTYNTLDLVGFFSCHVYGYGCKESLVMTAIHP